MRVIGQWAAGLAAALAWMAAAAGADCEDPARLRFSVVPAQDSAQTMSYYKPVLDLLERNTGHHVVFTMPTSYASVVEALLAHRLDVAVLGPESYIIARRKDPTVEVFATYFRAANGIQPEGPAYRSVLLTRRNTRLASIPALKGSVLALVDPASTSGGLIPEHLFPRALGGTALRQYFSRVVYSGGHDLSALAVADGRVDAAFVATHRFMEAVNAGRVRQEDFNVLWTSPDLPVDPFVLRTGLCPELRRRIADTFLTLDRNAEGQAFLRSVRSVRMVPMKDADYDLIRDVVR